jgi:uncharacterized membrane protein YsdA (DUF1294 family)
MTRRAATRRNDARPARRDEWGPRRPEPWRRPRLPFPPIVGGFLLAGAVLTAATAWLLVSHLHAGALVAYVAGVNLTTLGAYLYDKSVASAGAALWRVPEAVLHLLALAGGTPAAFAGQQLLRHKTSKPAFRTWFWVIVAIQAAALAGWVWGATHRP